MTIIIIGVIILLVGYLGSKADPSFRGYKSVITIIGIIVILVGFSMASVKQIEPGMVGVQKLFGKVNNNILKSGLNLVNPMVQVVMFDTRTQNYTMSASYNEGEVRGDDAIRVLSADGLEGDNRSHSII